MWNIIIVIGIFLVTLLINIATNFIIIRKVKQKYIQTSSPEEAMDILHKLGYVQLFILVITMIVAALSLGLLPWRTEGLRLIVMVTPILYAIIAQLINQYMMYPIITRIRNMPITRSQYRNDAIRASLFTSVPVIFVIFMRSQIFRSELFTENMVFFLCALIWIVFLFIGPMWTRWRLKATLFTGEQAEKLSDAIQIAGLRDVKLYIWPTTHYLIANALVTGVFKTKYIFLSDYLIEKLSIEEIKSILMHEIGHIKKRHLIKRVSLFLLGALVLYGMSALMDYIEKQLFHIPISLGIVFLLLIGCGFVYLVLHMYRRHELEADLYVIDYGINKDVFIDALTKLHELNHTKRTNSRFWSNLSTHPTLQQRINSLNIKNTSR